jgi:Asp-tRNA(Asn)/Glu-tRNA(Gln) amidotransferase A subunit family amidase
MKTRTQAPSAAHAGCDSFIASRLRAAGAVIIGKSNLRQWAAVSMPHASASWAGLTILAVDSEADGSIVAPASTCGLVAIQPTGRVAAGLARRRRGRADGAQRARGSVAAGGPVRRWPGR